jgi:TRAP-type C4-dicarboxylate transport system permease small subunit
MTISRKTALGLLAVLLVLLFFGTQMPGAWRDEVFRVTRLQPLRASVLAVALGALALALATEWFQRYVPGRDPSWHDVGIDMAGTVLGGVAAWLFARARKPVDV